MYMKARTNITVDYNTLKEAQSKGFNVSAVAESAIKDQLNKQVVEINTNVKKCDFCGKEEEKATRDNLKGLTWLWPDERWICENCLIIKGRRII